MTAEYKRVKKTTCWQEPGRMWYMIYLCAGVGINFLIHFTKPFGLNPGESILLGSLLGLGIPLATMFSLSYIHHKLLGL